MLKFLETLKKEHNDDKSLKALNEIENALTEKKYGLMWEKHSEKVDEMINYNIPIFKEIEEKKIVDDKDKPFNFLLEGDNLHSLKLLEKTHKEKIDVIYIDPPYNTGNKDFIYDDMIIDENDSFRHSKWLSFMSERLIIAKKILNKKGIIFIQISDKECFNLKLLCDSILGEDNYVNMVSVNMKNIAGASGGGEDKRLKKNCEYILIYAQEYDSMPLFSGPYEYIKMSDLVDQYKENGKSWKYTTVLLDEGEKVYHGSTVDGDGNEIKIFIRKHLKQLSVKQVATQENIPESEVYNKYGVNIFRTTNAQSSIRQRIIDYRKENNIKDDFLSIEYVPKTGKNKGTLYEQFYKDDKCNLFVWLKDTSEEINGILYKKNLQGTYWDMNAWMKNLTKEGNIEFSNGKKPLELLKRIISMYPRKNITILDFFAGSGTTGQAVMELNKEDGGNRKYILCTNNENNICENITYQRLKNIQTDLPHNLKYYKTDFIPKFIENDNISLREKMLEHIRELIELEHHIEIDNKNIIIEYEEEKIDSVIETIAKNGKLFIPGGIFLSSNQQLALDKKNIQLIEIPEYYFSEELREVGEI